MIVCDAYCITGFSQRRDTLRPVKRLDAEGSLRLSEDFVGTTRSSGSDEPPVKQLPPAPLDGVEAPRKLRRARSKHKHPGPAAVAGAAIVSEVILPTLENVSFLNLFLRVFNRIETGDYVSHRPSETIWMQEKSSL